MAQCCTINTVEQLQDLQELDTHQLTQALENEHIIHFDKLGFAVQDSEKTFFSDETLLGNRKNVSYDMARNQLQGDNLEDEQRGKLLQMLHRYALFAHDLIQLACPTYQSHLTMGRTSFRPATLEKRSLISLNQDDSLLHVDAFPSCPTQGKRILRVMTNVDLAYRPRLWHIAEEPFDILARRFALPLTPAPSLLLKSLYWLGLTKQKRTPYDDLMLKLHKNIKHDEIYQEHGGYHSVEFWPGSSWMAFTDQVVHAAISGQFCLEQTFYLPVENQLNPEQSPLRILESLKQKKLA